MAQILFGSDTTPALGDLDANFTELYALRNILGPSGGRLVASSQALKVLAPGESAQDVTIANVLVGSTNVAFNDPTRTANNRTAEWLWSAGALRGRFLNDAYSTATEWINVTGGQGAGITGVYFGGHTQPSSDNSKTLGSASFRWSVVYAGTGTINTSDARQKSAVAPLSSAEIKAARRLAREIGSFQFLEAVAAKGQAARQHIGMTVQRAMEIMREEGLEPTRYAFICHDQWAESRRTEPAFKRAHETLIDDKGRPVMVEVTPARDVVTPAGDRYGFRMDELLAFIARGLADAQDALERRLEALEAR